eukprot:gene18111-23765_t
MADPLVWLLVRNHNSFLVKRGRTKRDGAVYFSSEPGNLLNVNSFKYSGIANSNAVGITASKDNKITLTKKTGKDVNKPNKSTSSAQIKLDVKSGNAAIAEANTRGDLVSAAKARYHKLYRSVRIRRGIIRGIRPGKARGTI